MGGVHTTSEEFKNRVFILKRLKFCSVHTTPEKFENVTINRWMCVQGKRRQGNFFYEHVRYFLPS